MRTTHSNTLGRRRFLTLAAAATALTACGAPTTGTTPDDGAASGGGGEEDGSLTVATYIPPSYKDLYGAFTLLMDTATEASAGALSFEMFDSGTLLAADQLIPGLTRGVCDLALTTSSYVSTTYPVLGCYELPFVNEGTDQTLRALAIDGELFTLINEEIGKKGLRLLGSMPTAPEYIWTVDKPILKPGDLKGMRIRTAGNVEGETVKALGGAPISMSSAEIYEALERGTIDGMISYPGTVISRDLQNVLKFGTAGHFGLYSVDIYSRLDWYDALGEEEKTALSEGAKAYQEEGTAAQLKVHAEEYFPAMKEAGLEVVELDDQQTQAFKEATTGVVDWWKGRMEDAAVADQALELVQNA
ncbi:TRAP transporter substrate-binding protein [Ornithinimicrobium cavernae]|uniref:TRAP transporter substrate-binding protein n=1 Tax=Ornithinimicrobium cavernae TaxID=2666047 RepID=UPI000D68DDBB|nr:TRAP transporter substrate-binding protein DctP [Ornithinimicrobium cavernae]